MDKETIGRETLSQPITLNTQDLLTILPHRYPFLLLDRLDILVKGEIACGIKNVTINEPFFPGHFPGHPIMPGVLIVEALAQTAAALAMHSLDIGQDNHVVYFMSIQEARFRKPVMPGDRLLMHVTRVHKRHSVWKFEGKAEVDGAVHCEAILTATVAPKEGAKG